MGQSHFLLIALICLTIIFNVKCGPFEDSMQMQSRQLDTSCSTKNDCTYFVASPLIASVRCNNGECECFTNVNGTVPCIPSNNVEQSNNVGGRCPCLIPYTECKPITNTCECIANFHTSEDNRHCVPVISKLNRICEVDENCQRTEVFSTCSTAKEKVCQCGTGFIMHNDTCFSQFSEVETKCGTNKECKNIASNSICVAGKCVCRRRFISPQYFNEGYEPCLPEVPYGGACNHTRQCMRESGSGTICDNSTCLCQTGYYPHEIDTIPAKKTVCIKEIAYLDECTNHIQCTPGNEDSRDSVMECRTGKCKCKQSYVFNGAVCLPKAFYESSSAKASLVLILYSIPILMIFSLFNM